MNFISKFDINELVYFWSIKNNKILQGRISSISFFISKDSKCKWTYYVKTSEYVFSEEVSEQFIFRRKEDIINFCINLTNNI